MAEEKDATEFTLRLEGLSRDTLRWLAANPELAQHVVSRALSEASMVPTVNQSYSEGRMILPTNRRGVRKLLDSGRDAADANTQGYVSPEFLASIPNDLHPFIVPAPEVSGMEVLVSARTAADRLGVSTATVTSWISKNQILGFKSAGKNYLVPIEQIRGQRRIVPGIPRVIEFFASHEEAWDFLNEPLTHSDKAPERRPMELLLEGKLDLVLELATAYIEGYD
ncbi:hypothetical protein [Rhodovulum sp. P5]|uniref:hypothetical protein n=1 Tax=Rhodovulum sp. P5 TaxID=1564506 RepID=UPI0012EB7152|nr:hypothetical protein [Rhodovulum sp. P5]